MSFRELLLHAKDGDPYALHELYAMYKPLVIKKSIVDGTIDDDLYQELCLTFLYCVQKIKV